MSPRLERRVQAIRKFLARGSHYLVLTAPHDRPKTRRVSKPKR